MDKKLYKFFTEHAGKLTFLICCLFYFLPFKPKPFGDGEYHKGTLELLQFIGNGFNGEVEVSKGLMTLFYYAVPYSIFQFFNSDQAYYIGGILFNSICVSYAIYILFKALKLVGVTEKITGITCILINLFPIHAYYSMGILAESAAFLFVALFTFYSTKLFLQSTKTSDYILAALSLACFISVRPNFAPFIILYLLLVIPFMKNVWRSKLILAGSVVAFIGMFYTIEKQLDHSDVAFKRLQFLKGCIWSRYELRDEPFNWLPQHAKDSFASTDFKNNLKKREEVIRYCKEQNIDPVNYAFNWMLNDMKEHPVLTARQFLLKYFQSQTSIITPLMKSKKSTVVKWGIHIYINIVNYIILIVLFFSMYLMIKSKSHRRQFLPLLFLYLSSFITIFFLHTEQRYVFPARPAVLFMFAVTLYYFFEERKKKIQLPNSN